MTDKAIEIAEKVLENLGIDNWHFHETNILVKETAALIRPHLKPEYKYAQVPFSEPISADGFTLPKMQPLECKNYGEGDTDIQEALEWAKEKIDTDCDFSLYDDNQLRTLAAAYREACEDRDLFEKSNSECTLAYAELSAKYDRLMKAAMLMYTDLEYFYPGSKGIDMMEELL